MDGVMSNTGNGTQHPGGSQLRIGNPESTNDDSCRELGHPWRDWGGRVLARKTPMFRCRENLLTSGQPWSYKQGWLPAVVPANEAENVSGLIDQDSLSEPVMPGADVQQAGKSSDQREVVSNEVADKN